FTDGKNVNQRPAIEVLWDDTAIKANDTWSRGVNSMTHNQATDWFLAKDNDKAVMQDAEAAPWYARVNEDMGVELRKGGFYAAALQRLKDVGAFGFGALYSYEDDNKGHLSFENVPAPECYFTLTRDGLCRTFMRPLNLTAIEAEERGIDITKCAQVVQDALRERRQDTQFLFIHYVAPAKDVPDKRGINHDHIGFYYESQTSKIVGQHGFHDMPYHVLAWDPVPQSPYPTGIGYITLPEVRNINAQRKKFDRILDNESDSPVLAGSQDEGKEQARPQAGEMIYGGMSGEGRRLYDPLYQGATGSRILKDEIQTSRETILEAWHNNLMLMIANGTMTATEVASRDEKIIQAMGPFIIPMMADLTDILDRVFHSRMRASAYDPIPQIFDDTTEMQMELTGILAKAHKKLTANNITMFYGEALATVGQTQGGLAEIEGLNHGDALEHLGSARALPQGIMPTRTQCDERAAAQMEQQQQQMMMAQAPGMAAAAKDGAAAMAQMEQAGGGGVALAP
ncbi:MAG: portal protein, partial [Paracoccaceae bacterium]